MKTKIYESIVDKKNFHVSFWKTDDYKTYEEAERFGAVYALANTFIDYEAYRMAMFAAGEAAYCMDCDSVNCLKVRLTVDQKLIGDFEIGDCY
jgi:hypothetical protein